MRKNYLITILFISNIICSICSAQQAMMPTDSQQAFGVKGKVKISGENDMAVSIVNGELSNLYTSKNVEFISDDLVVYSDDFDFKNDPIKGKYIIAKGNPVKIKQRDVDAVCKLLEYYVDKNLTILKEDPVVIQYDENGGATEISGDTITIMQTGTSTSSVHADSTKEHPAILKRIPPPEKKEVKKVEPAEQELKKIESAKDLGGDEKKTPELSTDDEIE